MHWVRRVYWRLMTLFFKSRVEEETDEELAYHLEREIQRNLDRGLSPKDARREAHRAFGGVERTREQVREARGARGIDEVVQDIGFAVRAFRRRPAFSVTAVGLMALGIGATATMFSVVDGVLLKPLPYPDGERIVYVDEGSHSGPDFLAWRENLRGLENLSARAGSEGSLTTDTGPVWVRVSHVTPGFLVALGGQPLFGRLFLDDEEGREGAAVVLDHGFWVREWGADPTVIGRTLRLDGESVVVVGVLNPGFLPPEVITEKDVEVWSVLDPTHGLGESRDYRSLSVFGKLAEGTSIDAAQAEMDALTVSLAEEFPEYFVLEDGSQRRFPLVPLQEATVREVSGTLLLLLGAVGVLLLIAVANVANLFLAHGTGRVEELALRGALGAGKLRIVKQLLTESGFLSVVGGGFGVILAYLGVGLFVRFGPQDLPRLAEVSVDARVLVFSVVASVSTGLLCGLFPAFQAVGGKTSAALRVGAGRLTAAAGRRRLRDGLVVAELVLTVVLLAGAGLMTRSLLARIQVEPGFDSSNRMVLPMELGDAYEPSGRADFVDAMVERLPGLPGVESASAAWVSPFVFPPESCCWASRVWPEGQEDPGTGESTFIHPISPGYFSSLGVPLLRGEEFSSLDDEADGMVAVINPRLAQRLFGTEDVIGRQLMAAGNGPITVVGLEAGHHHWTLDRGVDEALYLPYRTWGSWFGLLHVVVVLDGPPSTAIPAVRAAVQELDPELAIGDIYTMEDLIGRSLATPRFLASLFGTFALVAFLLACGGVYASMLYSVGHRRREMGIRLALGARRGQVVGMVLRDGLVLTGVGLFGGLVLAVGFSRLLGNLVWGVSTSDVPTFLAASLLLGVSAIVACWIPAFRASRTEPVEVMKSD